jgi:hypothetical protein
MPASNLATCARVSVTIDANVQLVHWLSITSDSDISQTHPSFSTAAAVAADTDTRALYGSTPIVANQFLASGPKVKKMRWNAVLKVGLIVAAIALTGCGTPAAKNFGGKWKPVNHFGQQPTEIPLTAAYTYYAAPLDETLKTMLMRWANDSGRELSYELPFDVTLYTPVAAIRTTDLDTAAQQLTTIYAAQGVYVSATDRKILVRPAQSTSSAIKAAVTPASSASDAMPSPPVSSK